MRGEIKARRKGVSAGAYKQGVVYDAEWADENKYSYRVFGEKGVNSVYRVTSDRFELYKKPYKVKSYLWKGVNSDSWTKDKIYTERAYGRIVDELGYERVICFIGNDAWVEQRRYPGAPSCSETTLNESATCSLPTNEENTIMTHSTPAVETVTFVFGKAVKEHDDGEAITCIVNMQKKIDGLAAMELPSRKVQRMINELEAAISLLVEHLDRNEDD